MIPPKSVEKTTFPPLKCHCTLFKISCPNIWESVSRWSILYSSVLRIFQYHSLDYCFLSFLYNVLKLEGVLFNSALFSPKNFRYFRWISIWILESACEFLWKTSWWDFVEIALIKLGRTDAFSYVESSDLWTQSILPFHSVFKMFLNEAMLCSL